MGKFVRMTQDNTKNVLAGDNEIEAVSAKDVLDDDESPDEDK